jgi:hypothetical protein
MKFSVRLGSKIMRSLVIAAVALAGLSACNSTRQTGPSPQQQRQAQVKAAVASCDARAKSKQITTLAAYSRCVGAADAIGAEDAGEYADLLYLKAAKRTAIYERVDRGEITLAQAEAEIAQVNSALMGELNRRSTANRAAIAQEMSALSASSPATCSRFGNSVTCY